MPLAIGGGHARSDLVLNVVSQLMKTHGTVSRLEGRNLVGTRYLHKCVVDNRIVSGLLLALCPRGNQSMLFALLVGFAGLRVWWTLFGAMQSSKQACTIVPGIDSMAGDHFHRLEEEEGGGDCCCSVVWLTQN